MADFDRIIRSCVDDLWKHLNCEFSMSIGKMQVKELVCKMLPHKEFINEEFEENFTKFGKNEDCLMA